MKKSWLIVLGVVIAFGILLMGSYNGLVGQRELVRNKFSTIDVQLQRRADLIFNLVETVKGYASHETEAIKSVSDARAKLAGAGTTAEKLEANNEVSGTLSRLLAIAENYPNLKADANFRQLSDELTGTENRISTARIDYNNAVTPYNAKIKTFPTNLFAGMMGFSEEPYFEASESDKNVPKVSFN